MNNDQPAYLIMDRAGNIHRYAKLPPRAVVNKIVNSGVPEKPQTRLMQMVAAHVPVRYAKPLAHHQWPIIMAGFLIIVSALVLIWSLRKMALLKSQNA